ncbi:hypothetical protein [Methylocystis sp. ATCC 49242]|uniref:hypothetical protein n=1 Tax=Methylocystis sp. ATCC 49242 TaxID=622637 RepID=UPI0001F870ED|nr:hypothetical protein [Methylocystis sp. ATCC 49242]
MNRRAILAGLAIGMVSGLAALPGASLAADRHAPKNRQKELGEPSDAALGPRIDYPRHPRHHSSSSERYFTGGEVNSIPFRSPAEALEIVPGLAVGR